MSTASLGCTFQLFFEHVASSHSSALLVDYDGTLAPFHVDRDRAVPYPGVRGLLHDLSGAGVRVVVVSGRSAEDIQTLLNVPALEIWGCHGAERVLPNGERFALDQFASEPLIARILDAIAREDLLDRAEVKNFGVAIHWRGLSLAQIAFSRVSAVRALSPFTHGSLGLYEFDGGIELRSRTATKATAVQQILSEMPNTPIAYLGDDATDEDAFLALGQAGLTVLVRPEYRQTRAQLWLKPPDELLPFLSLWLSAAGGVK
jgi:trehalose 6-phosphate phosphatase